MGPTQQGPLPKPTVGSPGEASYMQRRPPTPGPVPSRQTWPRISVQGPNLEWQGQTTPASPLRWGPLPGDAELMGAELRRHREESSSGLASLETSFSGCLSSTLHPFPLPTVLGPASEGGAQGQSSKDPWLGAPVCTPFSRWPWLEGVSLENRWTLDMLSKALCPGTL